MKIEQYLQSILPVDTEESQIDIFQSKHEVEIKDAILKIWEEFKMVENCNSIQANITNEINHKQNKYNMDSSIENITKFENSLINESTDDVIKPDTNEEIIVINKYDQEKNKIFDLLIKGKHITLPNAKQNQEYCFKFNIDQLQIDEIGDYWFEGFNNIGIIFDSETNEIKGIPTKAGDHKIKFCCKRKDWTDGKPVFERSFIIIVNPDPRSLWRNIPTSEDIQYFKPDCESSFVKVVSKKEGGIFGIEKKEVARKDIVAASQRGRSHAHEGKPRDDDFKLHYNDQSEWYILSVADGAGSAEFSRKGSQIASNTVVEICNSKLENGHCELESLIKSYNKDKSDDARKKVGDAIYNIIGTAVFNAYKSIENEATVKGNSIKTYSTTLIVSICKKFDFGWFISAFWVGDGGIGIYSKEPKFIKLLGEPDGGEFAGQTRFLTMGEIVTSEEIYRRLRFEIVEDFTALILVTDGITDPIFETDANLNRVEKWDALWQDLSNKVEFTDDIENSAVQLLNWLDFWSTGNHDDRTIAILF